MKKVLALTLTPRSGMLHYASQFCNELALRSNIDLRVALASYYDGSLYSDSIEKIYIRTNPSPLSFIFDSLNIFYHLYFLAKILLFRPDIVHVLDNHPWYSIYVLILKLLGAEIFITQHDPFPHSGESRGLVSKMAIYTNKTMRKYADILIVHGDKMKQMVEKHYHIDEVKIISVPHGAYTFFNTFSQGLTTQKNTFLFFGRIVDYKGLDVLLESLGQVKEEFSDFQLIIAGPGDLSPYAKNLEKYKDNIRIYNKNIGEEEIYKYFEISEFVVLPYNDATGSGVIPVAYCFKKAVIATNVGELPSSIDEGVTGVCLPAKNPKLLGEEIIKFLKDKEKTKKMGQAGYEYSLKELSWQPIVDKIYDFET